MTEDLLQRAKKRARRITKVEIRQGNLALFESLGLDQKEVEQMAKTVGLELDDLLLLHPSRLEIRQAAPSAPGRPGRRSDTYDIAVFANERRPAMTWDEIYREWMRRYPNDRRVRSKESIREAHRRHFGDKSTLKTRV